MQWLFLKRCFVGVRMLLPEKEGALEFETDHFVTKLL